MSYNGSFKFSSQRLCKQLATFPLEATLAGTSSTALTGLGLTTAVTGTLKKNWILATVGVVFVILPTICYNLYVRPRKKQLQASLLQELGGLEAFLREEGVTPIEFEDHYWAIRPDEDKLTLELLYELAFPSNGDITRLITFKRTDGSTLTTTMYQNQDNSWSLN